MLTLKDHVQGNVEFLYYRAGNLMYKTSTGLEFPVPVSDADGTFNAIEKGLTLMRWIRKHLQENDLMGAPKSSEPIEVSKFLTEGMKNLDVTELVKQGKIQVIEEGPWEYTQNKFTP